MIEMLFGIYGLIWWLIFRKFKLLPINLWTVVTSILLIVVVLLYGLLMLSRYQPMSSKAVTLAITTPVIAEVQGRVVEVPVQGGVALEAGDVLFRVDPEPFEARLASIHAQLELAQSNLTQQEELREQGAAGVIELDRARADVQRLEADARVAQYQLDAATVRAPGAGYVTQVAVRPGQFVSPMAFSQVMVFVHDEGPYMVASFAQAAATHIDPGDEAEVAFHAFPGDVFSATVTQIQPVLAEGTISASGALKSGDIRAHGRVPVFLKLEADPRLADLEAGSGALVTVYTGKMHHLNLVRQIILRIKSWEHWVFVP